MKPINFIVLVFIIFILNSCTKDKNIEGLWSEYWFGETDVNYVDTLEIKKTGTGYEIELYNKQETFEPIYSNVLFDGTELTYKKEVDETTNYYQLKISEDGNWFNGMVKTWNGKERNLKLKNVK